MALRDELPSQWQDKPNITAIVDIFDARAEELEDALEQEIQDHLIDSSTWDGLREIFDAVAAHQAGALWTVLQLLDITEARRAVKMLAAVNRSDGDVESIIRVWRRGTSDLSLGISVQTTDQHEVTVQVEHGSLSSGFTDSVVPGILRRACGPGIVSVFTFASL